MKRKDSQAPAMVEDKAKEKRKKRAQDKGLIVIADKQKADDQMAKKKANSTLGERRGRDKER